MPVRRLLPTAVLLLGALLLIAGAATVPVAQPASAASLLPGFGESTLTSALDAPTAMTFAPDGRLFIAQQGGALRVFKNDALLATPFVTVPTTTVGERGLLGVAVDP